MALTPATLTYVSLSIPLALMSIKCQCHLRDVASLTFKFLIYLKCQYYHFGIYTFATSNFGVFQVSMLVDISYYLRHWHFQICQLKLIDLSSVAI